MFAFDNSLPACIVAGLAIGAMVGLSYSSGISATVVGGLLAVVTGLLTVADLAKATDETQALRREAIATGWRRVAALSAAIAIAAIVAAQFRGPQDRPLLLAANEKPTIQGLMAETISPALCGRVGAWKEADLLREISASKNATLKLMAGAMPARPSEEQLGKLAGAVELYCLARNRN